MNVVVVVGNPKVGSRTRTAAEGLVHRLTGELPRHVLELAELGPELLGWGSPRVQSAKEVVCSADLLVVASPTFKATYAGLLKIFLDQFGAGELNGLVTIPLMLGAGPHHALAPELTLRPVLVEIGASCPTPALYLLDSACAPDDVPQPWIDRALGALGQLSSAA